MTIAVGWILWVLDALWWVWVIFGISSLLHELDALLSLIDRWKSRRK